MNSPRRHAWGQLRCPTATDRMLAVCQSGWEAHLDREFAAAGRVIVERGPGWILTADPWPGVPPESAFAHCILPVASEVRGMTVNAIAEQLAAVFFRTVYGWHPDGLWPCVWRAAGGQKALARRAAAVERAYRDRLRRRLARLERLASREPPSGTGEFPGWWVYLVDFDRAFAANDAFLGGQRRMSDDPAAPSRSYLKIEEAYGILGTAPGCGETVVDLGAAPGGWSYSAARRGARVIAVDNGPLKGGALNHPRIEHHRRDAFSFQPARNRHFDWLFCDLVAEPHHVLRGIVGPWLRGRWCRHFVVNLKFGRADAGSLLQELRGPSSPFVLRATWFRIRHLFHDREEFTVVGEVRP